MMSFLVRGILVVFTALTFDHAIAGPAEDRARLLAYEEQESVFNQWLAEFNRLRALQWDDAPEAAIRNQNRKAMRYFAHQANEAVSISRKLIELSPELEKQLLSVHSAGPLREKWFAGVQVAKDFIEAQQRLSDQVAANKQLRDSLPARPLTDDEKTLLTAGILRADKLQDRTKALRLKLSEYDKDFGFTLWHYADLIDEILDTKRTILEEGPDGFRTYHRRLMPDEGLALRSPSRRELFTPQPATH